MPLTTAKLPNLGDTIIALSSTPGPGGRAIVRLSGRQARAIVAALCSDPEFERTPDRAFVTTSLQLPGLHTAMPADAYMFRGPRSYTGQDVVEVHLLSTPPIVEALIAQCLNAGARSAEPGEFTLRAFLAGKLDLTRAEAVLGVIDAGSRDELQHALKQLAGGVAQPLHLVRDDLLNLLADVEAGLDFTEEDIHFISETELLKRIGHALAHLLTLGKQLDGRALSQGPLRVVLAGKPNAGKSSLFNALVGKQAALVSPEPGTTRDYLEAIVAIGDMRIRLIDTAGLRDTTSEMESASQLLGKEQAIDADLILWCQACDDPASLAIPATAIRVWTKADIVSAPGNGRGQESGGAVAADARLLTRHGFATSVQTGAGLAELRDRIAERARQKRHTGLAPSLSRCRHHVDACVAFLRAAHAHVIEKDMPEFLAMELRLALDELGAMVGAVYTDDLLGRIFSRFCIGK